MHLKGNNFTCERNSHIGNQMEKNPAILKIFIKIAINILVKKSTYFWRMHISDREIRSQLDYFSILLFFFFIENQRRFSINNINNG